MEQIGRYRVVGELGRGAMGVVYRAEDPTIGRTVAIKTIRLSELSDASERNFMRERLLREARSAGILSHPGIVTIYDISEDEDTAYIFMEYVNGQTLEHLVAAGNQITKEQIFDYLRQTAAALDYAHEKGIVHRDIKPANIMISVDGEAKITDFGVAKILSQAMTQTRSVLGTPYYMSPEQIQGAKIDGRSDQFALGVIAYELMTGERPYTAESLPTLLFKIVRESPAPPERVNPSLASEVGRVFEKAFSKDPTQRFSNCTEFVNVLAMAANRKSDWQPLAPGAAGDLETDRSAAAPSAPPSPAVPRGAATRQAEAVPSLPRMPKTRDRAVLDEERESHLLRNVTLVILLLAMIAGGAYVYLEYFQPPPAVGQRAEEMRAATEPPPPEINPPTPPPAVPPSSGEIGGEVPASGQAATPNPAPSPPPKPAQSEAPPAATPGPPEAAQSETSPAVVPGPPAPAPPKQVKPTPAPPPPRTPPPKPKEYWVQIRSNPGGAQLSVDDDPELRCKTPCELPLRPGRHVLRVSLAGHRIAPRIIQVPEVTDVTVNLDREAGTLAIQSTPAGATIIINGETRPEKTPAMIKLPVGTYRLRLTLPDRPPFDDTVTVVDQVIKSVNIEW